MKIDKKTKAVAPPPSEYVITMNDEEALAVAQILGVIAGSESYPQRKITDQLYEGLCYSLGEKYVPTPFEDAVLLRKK